MEKRSKQAPHQRTYKEGKKSYEKMIICLRELQVKATMRCHYTPITMTHIQSTDNTRCWRGWGAKGLSLIAGGNANSTAIVEDSLAVS